MAGPSRLDGTTGPVVGTRFKAVNAVGSGPAWSNKPVVIVVDLAGEFAFERTGKFIGILEWRYRFESEGGSAGDRVLPGRCADYAVRFGS
ncbi:MAG: hypothetical protein WAW17_02805 [Rhodococcus sp. (in: high G+C Gram-positive bacteria)]|uniref:hypothetical protein n=1 Tax=Rhodococcus sp. TaxID=1831 RepID=UPI003BAE3AA8